MAHLTNSTKPIRAKEIERTWHLVDGKGAILGRLASQVAQILIGKHKTYYSPHLDSGDHVVVLNASEIEVTGTKESTKVYDQYSGYPGGLKKVSYEKMHSTFPERVIEIAVAGMLPKNKLRSVRMRRLHVFSGENHTFKDNFSPKKSQ